MKTENKVSHTPGPWTCSQGTEDMLMQAHFNVTVPTRPHTQPIAKCFSLTMNLQEAKANAELIASAPSLLSEVQSLREARKILLDEMVFIMHKAKSKKWGTVQLLHDIETEANRAIFTVGTEQEQTDAVNKINAWEGEVSNG